MSYVSERLHGAANSPLLHRVKTNRSAVPRESGSESASKPSICAARQRFSAAC
jgi:hypothetical protein